MTFISFTVSTLRSQSLKSIQQWISNGGNGNKGGVQLTPSNSIKVQTPIKYCKLLVNIYPGALMIKFFFLQVDFSQSLNQYDFIRFPQSLKRCQCQKILHNTIFKMFHEFSKIIKEISNFWNGHHTHASMKTFIIDTKTKQLTIEEKEQEHFIVETLYISLIQRSDIEVTIRCSLTRTHGFLKEQ